MTALALAFLVLAQQNDPAPKEAPATEALERFKTAYKSREVSDRATAVAELAKTPHEKVYAKLAALLVVDDMTVRIAAARGLGTATGDHRKKASAALGKAFGPNAGEPLVSAALVDALESIQGGLGIAVVKANLRSMDTATSRAAIEAAGHIRDKSFVPALIDHARFLEAASREATNVGPSGRTVTGGGIPGVGGPVGDPDAPKRAKLLVPLIHKALASITRQDLKTVADWQEWWRKNEADFTVPK
jgi:HEAT repeat protein